MRIDCKRSTIRCNRYRVPVRFVPVRFVPVPGIEIHIDAGQFSEIYDSAGQTQTLPLSRNVNLGLLDGGDRITTLGTGLHIDGVYFGVDGSVDVPGAVTRSLEDIKKSNFGNHDKKARELSFHYALLADHVADIVDDDDNHDPNGESKLLDYTGYGELSLYRSSSYHTIPGNDYILATRGARDPEKLFFLALSENDYELDTPAGFHQSQTLAHELGHNLGLLHGGVDDGDEGFAPLHRSLMSYSYTHRSPNDATSVDDLIRDYADASDAVYDDWSNIQMDFARYFDTTGNSLGILKRNGEPLGELAFREDTLAELEALHGTFDRRPPTVDVSDNAGSSVELGGTLTVNVSATDNLTVAQVLIDFDVDGDGAIDTRVERFPATPVGGDLYRAIISGVSGGAGFRAATAIVIDVNEFVSTSSFEVTVGNPPIAVDDQVTAAKDTPLAIDVLANDQPGDGALVPATVVVELPATHGTLAVDSVSGEIVYSPEESFFGEDQFGYRVSDDQGGTSKIALVSITVTQQPPVAGDDTATTVEDVSVTIPVLQNDVDPDGELDRTSLAVISPPANGVAVVDPLGVPIVRDFNDDGSFVNASPFIGPPDAALVGVVDEQGVIHVAVTGAEDTGFTGAHSQSGQLALFFRFNESSFVPPSPFEPFDVFDVDYESQLLNLEPGVIDGLSGRDWIGWGR